MVVVQVAQKVQTTVIFATHFSIQNKNKLGKLFAQTLNKLFESMKQFEK